MASTVHPIDTPEVLADINKLQVLSDNETTGYFFDSAKTFTDLLDAPSNAAIKAVYPSRSKIPLTAEQLVAKKNQDKYEARKIMKNLPAYLNLTTTYLRVIYILSERILIQGNKNSEISFKAEESVYQNGTYMRTVTSRKFTYKDLRILFDLTLKDRVSSISRIYNNSRKRITASRTALNDPVYMTASLHEYLTALININYPADQLRALSDLAKAAVGMEIDPSGQTVVSRVNSRLVINNIIRRAYAVNSAASGKDITVDVPLERLIMLKRPFSQKKKPLSPEQLSANNHTVAFLDFYAKAKKTTLRASQKVQTSRVVDDKNSSFYDGLTADEQRHLVTTRTITSSMLNSLVSCHTIGAGDFEKFEEAKIPNFLSLFHDTYANVKAIVLGSLASFKEVEAPAFNPAAAAQNHVGLILKNKIASSAVLGAEYKRIFEDAIKTRKNRTLEEGKRRREALKGRGKTPAAMGYNATQTLTYGQA